MPNALEIAAAAAASTVTLKPLSGATARFLRLLLKPGAEQAGGWLGDRIQIARRENIEKLVAKTKANLSDGKIDPKQVSTKILIPILEHCSVEDENEMIDRWSNLLTSAATGNFVPPAFVQTLSCLSPVDARLLDCLAKSQKPEVKVLGPNKVQTKYSSPHTTMGGLRALSSLGIETFDNSILSLYTLGLVVLVFADNTVGGNPHLAPTKDFQCIGTTSYCNAFLSACAPKQEIAEN